MPAEPSDRGLTVVPPDSIETIFLARAAHNRHGHDITNEIL